MKSAPVKLAMVVFLSFVFMVVGYLRFIHPKRTGKTVRKAQVQPAAPGFRPPEQGAIGRLLEQVGDLQARNGAGAGSETSDDLMRDLFGPPEGYGAKEGLREGPDFLSEAISAPSQAFTLRGTMVGGKRPVAVINDQFLRPGDSIGGYRVARIGRKEVILEAGGEKVVVSLVKMRKRPGTEPHGAHAPGGEDPQ